MSQLSSDWFSAFQATPHVAGLVAYLAGKDGNVTPAAMSTKVKNLCVKDAISGIRESILCHVVTADFDHLKASGTVNNLANNA